MIGGLRNRLLFERKIQTEDGAGGFSENWDIAFSVWGTLEAVGGRENVSADSVAGETSYRVRIRYRADAAADMRIKVGSRVLAIEWIGDPDGRRYWLDLGCVEGRPS